MKKVFGLCLTICLIAGPALARDQIRIVGSSTVYPFAAAVAEQFTQSDPSRQTIVESTGSGAGFKLFCASNGEESPDITNSSRKIKDSEIAECQKNGVTQISEVEIGYDGIVLAQSKKAAPMKLSLRQIYMALAKTVPQNGAMVPNPYSKWSDIDPQLPNIKISVMGPPPTSGTRDSFVEMAMEGGCKTFPEIAGLKAKDEKAFKAQCHTLREDGAFIEAGENDNLIVQKIEANNQLIGVFGYSFLDNNRDYLTALSINGVSPSVESIQGKKYALSRPLYFYVKTSHVQSIPAIKDFVAEFTSEKTFGDNGYLSSKGLVPLTKAERKASREKALAQKPLAM